MREFILHSVSAFLPDLVFSIPYFGTVDFTPFVLSILIFLVLRVLCTLVKQVILARLREFSKRTITDIDDVVIGAIADIRSWILTLIALFVALNMFVLPAWLFGAMTAIVLFAVVWQTIEIITRFVDYGTSRFMRRHTTVPDGGIDPNAEMASDMVQLLTRIVLWVLGIIFILSNLHVEVISLVTGLGIGGIAIAIALQGILSDFFNSFSIYFDKPFRIGEFITVGEHSGTVERIGVKTTRIRTLQGEELVVSNAELTSARVQNWDHMRERRVSFTFQVVYETPHELVKAVPDMLARIISECEYARFDRAHFVSFAESGLEFEVVYYVESPVYVVYRNVNQAVHFAMLDAFAETGIEFSYPTRTVFVKKG